VWAAITDKQPIKAVYQQRLRLFSPHGPGRNREGRLRVLCQQDGGDRGSGFQSVGFAGKTGVGWRCRAQQCEVGRCLALAPNHSRPNLMRGRSRHRCRGSCGARSAKRALRQLPQQQTGQNDTQRRDGVRIMPLRAWAATRVGGSPATLRGQGIPHDRRGQRGKNGSARLPGTHKLRYIVLRGGGTRASCGLQSAPAPTLVSTPRSPAR
jgi:hypothetical protein